MVRVSPGTLESLRRLRDEMGLDSFDAVVRVLIDMYTRGGSDMYTRRECRASELGESMVLLDCGGGMRAVVPAGYLVEFASRYGLVVVGEWGSSDSRRLGTRMESSARGSGRGRTG